jgi:5'-nucleotidase
MRACMKTILLSNDDGIQSRGIWALYDFFSKHFQVFVVAPDRERSAAGHSISLRDPIRLKTDENDRVFSVDGTPVDAVHVALLGILKTPVDFVITGINNGLNLGSDVFYSGTVSAAFQATTFNIPGIAVSIDNNGEKIHYETAAFFLNRIIKKIKKFPLGKGIILNVNVPNLELGDIAGMEITKLGKRCYNDSLIEREDPKKNKYYWIAGKLQNTEGEAGTDVKAIDEKKVSITPLRLDITAFDFIERLKEQNFHEFD